MLSRRRLLVAWEAGLDELGRARDVAVGDVTFLFTDVEGLRCCGRRTRMRCRRRSWCTMRFFAGRSTGMAVTCSRRPVTRSQRPSGRHRTRSGQPRIPTLAYGPTWPGPALKVRMGLHLGEAEERGGDYFGPVVNTAARFPE